MKKEKSLWQRLKDWMFPPSVQASGWQRNLLPPEPRVIVPLYGGKHWDGEPGSWIQQYQQQSQPLPTLQNGPTTPAPESLAESLVRLREQTVPPLSLRELARLSQIAQADTQPCGQETEQARQQRERAETARLGQLPPRVQSLIAERREAASRTKEQGAQAPKNTSWLTAELQREILFDGVRNPSQPLVDDDPTAAAEDQALYQLRKMYPKQTKGA